MNLFMKHQHRVAKQIAAPAPSNIIAATSGARRSSAAATETISAAAEIGRERMAGVAAKGVWQKLQATAANIRTAGDRRAGWRKRRRNSASNGIRETNNQRNHINRGTL